MKKIKVFSLFLALSMILFCGCGDLNNNLKLTSTTMSSSSFYFNLLNQKDDLFGQAIQKSSTASEKAQITNLFSNVFGGTEDLTAIICTVDFCISISDGNKNNPNSKIYENSYNNKSEFVEVIKKSKSGNVFNSKYYIAGENEDFSDSVARDYFKEYEFTVKPVMGKYSVNYKINNQDCSAIFYFDNGNGYMDIELNSFNAEISNKQIKTTISICSYKNNVYASRVIVSYTALDGSSRTLVWECLQKTFLTRAKIGRVEKYSEYKDLKQIEEPEVGVSNYGDDFGFMITSNQSEDASEESKRPVPYGIFRN